MSAHNQIFLKPLDDHRDVAADVRCAAGLPVIAEVTPVESFASSSGVALRTVIELELGHPYDTDGYLPLAEFPLVATIRNLDGDRQKEQASATDIARQLDQTGQYEVLVVFDLQQLVWDSRSPDLAVSYDKRARLNTEA